MSSNDLLKSAYLKIDRAKEHIDDINKVLKEKRPFRYFIETDAKTGRRATMAEKDEAVVDALSLRCGDAIHNLRSALDHAYVAVVSPHANTPGQRRKIQFPFSETSGRLEETCKNRLAHKVSPDFLSAMIALKPHGEPGGNEILYFMHSLDLPDKHTHLVPTAYCVNFTFAQLRKIVPDLPGHMTGQVSFSENGRDFCWDTKPFTLNDWVMNGVSANGILKEEINVPVEIGFKGGAGGRTVLAVPTLYQFVDVTNEVVKIISRFK